MSEWKRPEHLPYPSVWLRFKAKKSKDSDELVDYRVQDLPEERFEEALQHMIDNFLHDENTCRLTGNLCFYGFNVLCMAL